jgi:hypothetical protein
MAKRKITGGDYEVGHGRPPKATQFKPGTSGNPRGRPKEAKTLEDVLYKRFFAKVSVRENGKTRRLTVLEIIIGRLAKGAADGDMKSIAMALKLLGRLQRPGAEADQGAVDALDADRIVLEELVRMMGGSIDQLLASQEG